jgi:hypothetical protein
MTMGYEYTIHCGGKWAKARSLEEALRMAVTLVMRFAADAEVRSSQHSTVVAQVLLYDE